MGFLLCSRNIQKERKNKIEKCIYLHKIDDKK